MRCGGGVDSKPLGAGPYNLICSLVYNTPWASDNFYHTTHPSVMKPYTARTLLHIVLIVLLILKNKNKNKCKWICRLTKGYVRGLSLLFWFIYVNNFILQYIVGRRYVWRDERLFHPMTAKESSMSLRTRSGGCPSLPFFINLLSFRSILTFWHFSFSAISNTTVLGI